MADISTSHLGTAPTPPHPPVSRICRSEGSRKPPMDDICKCALAWGRSLGRNRNRNRNRTWNRCSLGGSEGRRLRDRPVASVGGWARGQVGGMPRVGQMSPSQGGGGGKPPQGPSLAPRPAVLCQETLLTRADPDQAATQVPCDPTFLTPDSPVWRLPFRLCLPACLPACLPNYLCIQLATFSP